MALDQKYVYFWLIFDLADALDLFDWDIDCSFSNSSSFHLLQVGKMVHPIDEVEGLKPLCYLQLALISLAAIDSETTEGHALHITYIAAR